MDAENGTDIHGTAEETDLRLGLARKEPLPHLDMSHRPLVSEDSNQRPGMKQKGILSSIGRQSDTDLPLGLSV